MDGFLLRYNKNIKYAIIDTETYCLNLSPEFNRPWAVGIIEMTGENVISSIEYKIDWTKQAPNLHISKEAADKTRFNAKEHALVAKQPEEVFDSIDKSLKNCDYIIGQNFYRFDLYLLRTYYIVMNKDWRFIVPKMIDTMSIAKGIKLGIPYSPKQGDFIEYQYRMANLRDKKIKASLGTLCKENKIEYDGFHAHSAVYDAERTMYLWNKLKWQIEK